MNIAYLTNASAASGVGYYAEGLRSRLGSLVTLADIHIGDHVLRVNGQEVKRISPWPGLLGMKSIGWVRLSGATQKAITKASPDIVHITNQTMSFVRSLQPTVLTVHDIIEVLEPQNRKAALLNRYVYRGISKADAIIAVSDYTKKSLMKYYGIADAIITVIPNGVDSTFHPIPDFRSTVGYQALCQELRLTSEIPIVLFVGSEHPRKNIGVALRAFAQLRTVYPSAIFLKVGEPGIREERARTLGLIDELGLRSAVRLIGHVSVERLNELYNLATVLVMPSSMEGFGLPPLQAMAAGLPIVASTATSLPEVVGEAGILLDPQDATAFANALTAVIGDTAKATDLRERGFRQARLFNWDHIARTTMAVYNSLL